MSVLKLLRNPRYRSNYFEVLRSENLRRRYLVSSGKEEIVIPKRIPRGPTDILKALAGTVKRDPTAAHYKYHDDPFLIPLSNSSKRTYALAQESGRKAALWIKDQNPSLFIHRAAEPPIQAFFPKAEYDETDDLDNEMLSKVIKCGPLSDAIQIYNIMKNRGDEISEENKQSLLEQMCFFNESEQLSEELIEERWFTITNEKNTIKKTWKDDGFAQKLFEELPPSAETFSALIQGMAKYYHVDKAFQYYDLSRDNGYILSPDAYNALIKIVFLLNESVENRWKKIEELLKEMNENGFIPSVHTLNAVLFSLKHMFQFKNAFKLALKMLAEVKTFGVEPSLASYYHLLLICYKERNTGINIISSILDNLEGRKLIIQDPYDVNFFVTAMEKCCVCIRDKEIAHRINRLLWDSDNYNFIGNSYNEAIYYRHYLILLCKTELLEDVMKIYDYLVPNIYIPEFSVMNELIRTVTMNGAVELYAKLWTEIVTFELYDKYDLLSSLLEGMVLNREPLSDTPSKNTIQLSETAWSIFNSAENIPFHKNPVEWTSKSLSNAMMLFLHANDFTKATEILKKFRIDGDKIFGVPETETMSLYVDSCIKNNNLKLAMETVVYCANNGYGDTKDFARRIIKKFTLSPATETHLISLVGPDVFKIEAEDKEEKSTLSSN